METWMKISLLLCTYGFFRELRPSDPFVMEYLTSDWFNFTAEQVYKELFPFGTYAILAQLVIVFLITDILRYKPIIILSACAGVGVFTAYLWANTLFEMKMGQIVYGTFLASEVAYYTYIYAKVDREHYQLVTGQTRSAVLTGRFLGSVVAQILISTSLIGYRELCFISFGTQIISLVIAISLPSVPRSLYFYAEQPIESGTLPKTEKTVETQATVKPKFSWRHAGSLLWQHTVSAYSKPIVVRWSLWWALATCGQLMVIAYIQILWKEIAPKNESFYNGATEAAATLLGAASAFGAGFINSKRRPITQIWILTMCTLMMGAFILIASLTHLIWVAYVMYVIFCVFYSFVITNATSIVASNLKEDSFGLIFGINTLVALMLQSLMTFVVLTDSGLGLAPRAQFTVYGGYFLCLAVLYFFVFAIPLAFNRNSEKVKAKTLAYE